MEKTELEREIEEQRSYHKEYSIKNKDKKNATTKKWIKNNRQKFNDKIMTNYENNKDKWYARDRARKKIKIPDGQRCQICNKNPANQRHHQDYSKPLKVIFICVECHRKVFK